MAADHELDPIAWRELAGERLIGGDDGDDLGIATARLPIGHEQDRLA